MTPCRLGTGAAAAGRPGPGAFTGGAAGGDNRAGWGGDSWAVRARRGRARGASTNIAPYPLMW